MTKKCDIKGCKEKAVVFTKGLAFCANHAKQINSTEDLLLNRGVSFIAINKS
jgi:hypothetical protein